MGRPPVALPGSQTVRGRQPGWPDRAREWKLPHGFAGNALDPGPEKASETLTFI